MSEKLLYFKSWITTKFINLLGNKSYPFASILVVKRDEIGDMITAMHVFYNLKEQFPNAKFDLYCKPFNTVFFKHLDYVNCFTEFNDLKEQYDLIVELRGDEQTLNYSLKNRPKYKVDRGSIRFKNKFFGGQKNELDTNLEVIAPLLSHAGSLNNKISLSPQEYDTVDKFIEEENIKPFVVLHLGARDAARRWPTERFAKCINYINEVHGMACLLAGGPDDKSLNDECLSYVKSKRNINVAGSFNLLEFTALCERAALFLGNESGPLHIASAQGIPVIALFGPGVKDVFYPKGDNVKIHHYFLARGHKQQTLENSTIFSIQVEEVQESIDALLKLSS